MASSPILLFDIMDTVVHDPFRDELLELLDMELETFLEVADPTAWAEFERHEIDEATFVDRLFEERDPPDPDSLRRTLREAYRFVDDMEALLECLAEEGYEIHALSNYPIWYRIIEEELELSRFLSWTFVSWKTGYRKPDPGAYEHALDTLGVRGGHCLFVDNRTENCEAARECGLPALEFRGADPLRRDLRERLQEASLS